MYPVSDMVLILFLFFNMAGCYKAVKKKARQMSIWSLNNNMNHYCLPDLGFILVKVVYLTQEKAKVLIIYLINP